VTEFERFRECVFADRKLQDALMAETDADAFVELVARLARARGCDVSGDAVRQEMRASRLGWLERFAR
jgi:hypothetical protein